MEDKNVKGSLRGKHSNLMRAFNSTLAVAVLTLIFTGCSRQQFPAGMPPLQPITIVIMQDGKPLAGASIALFSEDDANSPWSVGGTSDQNGRAVLATHGKYNGAPAGRYKVCVSKVETVNAPGGNPSDENASIKRPDEFDLVEPTLKSPLTTTLSVEIKTGKNSAELDAGKAVRKKIDSGGA
ncbi:MAG: prealbumin-like fold domain-containing protein [Planctomycetaceae bacterium]|nr:prealbumin-like fold domain-containing protein [Planctomycetaceae bacterium]